MPSLFTIELKILKNDTVKYPGLTKVMNMVSHHSSSFFFRILPIPMLPAMLRELSWLMKETDALSLLYFLSK